MFGYYARRIQASKSRHPVLKLNLKKLHVPKFPARCAVVLSCMMVLGGCAFPGVYRIDIPQGNIITQEMIDQLRPGLTKRQVTFILGTPLIRDTFDQDRWDYLYSYQPGGGERVQERITVFFDDNGELTHFEGDFEQTPENLQFPAQQAQGPANAAPRAQ
jgi:outer membrane protein assembly factor BamE